MSERKHFHLITNSQDAFFQYLRGLDNEERQIDSWYIRFKRMWPLLEKMPKPHQYQTIIDNLSTAPDISYAFLTFITNNKGRDLKHQAFIKSKERFPLALISDDETDIFGETKVITSGIHIFTNPETDTVTLEKIRGFYKSLSDAVPPEAEQLSVKVKLDYPFLNA